MSSARDATGSYRGTRGPPSRTAASRRGDPAQLPGNPAAGTPEGRLREAERHRPANARTRASARRTRGQLGERRVVVVGGHDGGPTWEAGESARGPASRLDAQGVAREREHQAELASAHNPTRVTAVGPLGWVGVFEDVSCLRRAEISEPLAHSSSSSATTRGEQGRVDRARRRSPACRPERPPASARSRAANPCP